MTEEEVVSVTRPSESSFYLAVIVILGIIDVVFIGLSLIGLAGIVPEAWGWDQFVVGGFVAFAFLIFTLILLIYWNEFMPFTLIRKTRRGKKEIADDYYREINYD